MNTLINVNVNDISEVKEYTIKTKDGKSLVLAGELAKNVSAIDTMAKASDKASLYKAIFITKIVDMKSKDFKDKYNVSDGTVFVTKFLGYTKTTVGLYTNTVHMFFNDDIIRYQVLEDYNLAQLQELYMFVKTYMTKYDVTEEIAISALLEIVRTEFPFTMATKKLRKAIKEYFNTVEAEAEETEAGSEETEAGKKEAEDTEATEAEETETEETEAATLETKCLAVLSRCKVIREECFDENGRYKGDEIEAHFLETINFILEVLKR